MAVRRIASVSFKPITRIDPEQSRAAQIARRGPGITVKFPPIDFANLPEWPPLTDDDGESIEDCQIGEENADDESNFGSHPSTTESPQPLKRQRTRSLSRKLSVVCERTPRVAIFDRVDTFVPSRRRAPMHKLRAPRRYIASDPLQTHLLPKHAPDLVERATSVHAVPAPNRPSSPSRLNSVLAKCNNALPPITDAHASRLESCMATHFVSSVGMSQAGFVRSNSHVDLTTTDDDVTVMREGNMGPPVRNVRSLGPIPEEFPGHVPTGTAQVHQAAEGNSIPAVQSTFKMAMALSKPYQPGQHAPSYQFIMAFGNFAYEGVHLMPGPHLGGHRAESSNGNNEFNFTGNREPRLPSTPANLGMDRGPVGPLIAEASPSRNDVSAAPLEFTRKCAARAHNDQILIGEEPEFAALERKTDGGNVEHRPVNLSHIRSQQEEESPTMIQASRLQETNAPAPALGVGQKEPQQSPITANPTAEDGTQHELTSENIALLQQQKAWQCTDAQLSSSVAASITSSTSSGRQPVRDDSGGTRNSLFSSRPPTHRPGAWRPTVDDTRMDDTIRQAPENPAVSPLQFSADERPEKRRRIKEENDDGDDYRGDYESARAVQR